MEPAGPFGAAAHRGVELRDGGPFAVSEPERFRFEQEMVEEGSRDTLFAVFRNDKKQKDAGPGDPVAVK